MGAYVCEHALVYAFLDLVCICVLLQTRGHIYLLYMCCLYVCVVYYVYVFGINAFMYDQYARIVCTMYIVHTSI